MANRIDVRVTLENGDSWTTGINLSFDEAVKYYLGNSWGDCDGNYSKCIKVELL